MKQKTERAEYWEGLVSEQAGSDATVKEFCEQRQLASIWRPHAARRVPLPFAPAESSRFADLAALSDCLEEADS